MTVNKVLDLWSLTVSKDTNIEILQGVPYVFAAFLVVNAMKSGENIWRTLYLIVSLEGYHLNWRKSKHKNGGFFVLKNSNSERI